MLGAGGLIMALALRRRHVRAIEREMVAVPVPA
jgi:hypothetical protein